MAAMSQGQVARQRLAKRPKGSTPSSRKHHFESFTTRVAKINIEPIRRGRSTILDDAELDGNFSYFKKSLEEWRDVNTSEAFTAFARQVASLCQSLPQILHHNERIADLLVQYVEKGDNYSAEPLLSLMAHFAHDLGVRFEQHFDRVVKAVSRLAAKHQDVEVIEWSFTCLAWLFKYLSRLLVPDLRRLFDLMAPLLGKERQKYFVTRFAAESLSFLVRKAGALYHKDKAPLRLILEHISDQLQYLQGSGEDSEFLQGLQSLFADSMKGTQRGMHSSAPAIMQEMLLQTYDKRHVPLSTAPLEPVVISVLTSVIHHCDADGFQPLLNVVLTQIKSSTLDVEFGQLSSRLIFVVCGVRKGSRVKEWTSVLDTIALLLDAINSKDNLEPADMQSMLSTSAVVFQYCPFDAAIPRVQFLEGFSQGQWETHFLPFCTLFADIGNERFKSLLLPYFKRFVTQKAEKYSAELSVALPGLSRNNTLSASSIHLSTRWQEDTRILFAGLDDSSLSEAEMDRVSYKCNAFLEVTSLFNLPEGLEESISNHLLTALQHAGTVGEGRNVRPIDLLATGSGFRYLTNRSERSQSLRELWPALCGVTTIYAHSQLFWEALLSLVEKGEDPLEVPDMHRESFKANLMSCLGSPSHSLRLAALGILEGIAGNSEEQKDIIATAMMIEQTPLSLDNARSISMRIRQLSKSYPALCSDEWVTEAIPTFCFGLLHVKLAQIWDDAITALKEMCGTKEGENIISRIAFKWLEDHEQHEASGSSVLEKQTSSPRYATEFECTNVMQLEQKISEHMVSTDDVEKQLEVKFAAQHVRLPLKNPFCRTQALRLLNTIPHVAEKRSRLLVPALLKWALEQPAITVLEEDVVATGSSEQSELYWSRKDQKAMLSIFSQFANPRVLFRSTEVYDALLVLLSNGDVDIQKATLKAILTWKDSAIVRYQENLFNLLDDARFREEVSVFMDASDEESHVQAEHREQLLPVILRLLYGKVISGRRGQEAKRKAVFIALTRFDEAAIHNFLGIAFGPLAGVSIIEAGQFNAKLFAREILSPRKQLGMLNMLEDMLNTLKTTLTPFTSFIIDPLLYCLIKAARASSAATNTSDIPDGNGQSSYDSLNSTIRKRGFHSLNILFESCPEFPWETYIPIIVEELVKPRLEQLPIETAQSVSGLLRLFAAWSKSLRTAPFLVKYNSTILSQIISCLDVSSAKDEIKQFVLDDILRSLTALVSNESEPPSTEARIQRNQIHSNILQPYADAILQHVGDLLRKSPSKDLLESGVQTIAELAPHIAGHSESMIEIATFLLRQPSKRVSGQTKFGLLNILHQFIPRCDGQHLGKLFDKIFDAIGPMFSSSQDRAARAILCDIIEDLSEYIEDLAIPAKICLDLNSFSRSRLDEPDFDRRSNAFNTINHNSGTPLSLLQWKPVVYNMLFYIRDNDELSIRVNASLSLQHFIDVSVHDQAYQDFLSSTVLPGIQHGIREISELVRVEYLTVLAHLVRCYPNWPPVADLHVLLGTDEESSFFNNILHIQGHRRLRALRRLASSAHQIKATNISHLLIPLLEHFIFSKAEDENAHNIAGEAIRTVAALLEWLDWPQFRSLLKKFIGYLSSKEDMQKTVIKLLAGMMDSLNRAGHAKGYITAASGSPPDDSSEHNEELDGMAVDPPVPTLSKTLPQQEKLTKDLTGNLLPPLTDFLHNKDEATVSLRVPIAVALVKVLLVLPPEEIATRLPPVLLDICHILKSKSEDARNMSRNTLSEIAALAGPTYLGFILKSLRTALQRGYQLHVLSFSLHHILVKLSPHMKPGDIDYCLFDVVDVIMDDIFGVSGQEKDEEGYKAAAKEVKSNKSYDSMDIIAQSATPGHLVQLIQPIKALLLEKLTAKMVQKISELLRRVGLGVLQNPAVKDRDILVFCYELIQEVYNVSKNPNDAKTDESKNKRYLVNMRGAAKSAGRTSTSSYIYKLTRFSLDILRTVLRKHEGLQTPQNIAGFLPIIGDALVQGHEEVQISATRLLTTIIRVPLAKLDDDCPIYVSEAVRTIRGSPSANTELAQASLKMVSAVLRERPNVTIKERDLAYLLQRLIPDLDEPDRQGVTFGFLRAIMHRKIVIAEIYEVMDKVATMMVTNQTRSIRDLARSNYFHFLMEYPQAKNRFSKQIEFLVRNLRYAHVEGRQAVLECLNLILTKVGDDVLQDVLGMMFIPLVNSMANDDSSDCRAMAGALIKQIFERADFQRLKSFTSDLRGWLEQDDDAGLKRLGIQCWGLYFEVVHDKPKEVEFVLQMLQSTVEECLDRRDEDDWELIYYSLTVFSKLCKSSPDMTFSSEDYWAAIQSCVSYPHAWVKLTAAKLMGIFFADLASTNGDSGLDVLPLAGSRGLQFTESNMIQLANGFLKNLSIPNVTEELCAQSVRNLAFLARCLAVNDAKWNWHNVDDDEEIDETSTEVHEIGANGDAVSTDEEWGGFSPPPRTQLRKTPIVPTAIHRLMTRLSGIIRRETKIMKLPSLYPKSAVLNLLETITAKLPIEPLVSALPHLLTTLHTLTDPATTIPRSTDPAFNDTYKALIDKAREVMGILQKRMGAKEYLEIMGDVQKAIRERREGRRSKRKIDAITMPEKWGLEKKRRHEVARKRKKEKSAEERGRRRGW